MLHASLAEQVRVLPSHPDIVLLASADEASRQVRALTWPVSDPTHFDID